jgi:diguanylate cyclase (GGDEF)-like protein
MRFRSFQAKLLYLMVAVLVLLQTATLVAVHVANRETMQDSIDEELRVGSRVLDQILAARGRRLLDNVRVLASDYAFRETVAVSDRGTIASVVGNHATRITASAAFLISPDGMVTVGEHLPAYPFPLRELVAEAQQAGEAEGIVSVNNRPFQLVVVPVLAPRPIAWVCMGFEIDRAVLSEVHRMTGLEVSLAAPSTDGEYRVLRHPLRTSDHSHAEVVLRRSIEEAARPYRRLELQIFGLSTLALLLAVFAARFFARGVSRPLRQLAGSAQRIERGDYAEPIALHQRDEIGKLANAFDRMRTGIADREERIRYQATHDALTGLPNRVAFVDQLIRAIVRSRTTGELVAIIVMDVDRFKEINDTLGHTFGDDLLKEFGTRLSATLPGYAVARLGGDEFAVLFTAADAAASEAVAYRIKNALETPFALAGVAIEVNASMGIAMCPQHGDDAETLMKRADVAMYDAKEMRVPVAVYAAGSDEHSLRRLAMLSELRTAIAKDELALHYQPKVGVLDGHTSHAEALVRWQHPVHGIVRPDEFIPLAEQSGNIGMITRWVLRRAISDCGRWNASGLDITVAVNLSALDLFDLKLPAYIDELLRDAHLSPSKLVLEITESAVMRDPEHASRILEDLKARGVSLAIDDYGTGYSSLAHLKRLPVDELKIDKSFVVNLAEASRQDILIIRSTIELGHNMGLKVIAEGVEDAASWQILKDLGCDMAQGFYVSRPLPLGEFQEWFGRFGRNGAASASAARS